MADEILGAELELDIGNALSSIDTLGQEVESALGTSADSFAAAMADAVASIPEADVSIVPDATEIEPAVSSAVDSADSTVEIDAVGADAITGDIDAAVGSANTEIEVTADVTAADSAINSIVAEPILLEVDADTADASASLDALGSSASSAGGGMSQASHGAEEMGHATEFASISAGLAVGETEHLASAAKGVGGGLGVAAGAGLAFAGTLGEMFSAGVNATGAAQRFNSILGEQKDAVEQVNVGNLNENLSELGMSLGTTRAEMENSTASTFQFATVSGAGGEAAGTFSERIAALSARAVALNPNLGSVGDVAESMSTRLARGGRFAAGFGISLTAAEINARALADTGKTAASDLTLYEKAAAGAAIATDKYGSSLSGTIESGTQNAIIQNRKLKAEFEEIIETIGGAVVIPMFDLIKAGLPIVESFGRIVQTLAVGALPVLTSAVEAVQVPLELLADALDLIAPAIGPIVTGFLAFEAASLAVTTVEALGVALGFLPGVTTEAAVVNAAFAASEVAVGSAAEVAATEVEASSIAMMSTPIGLIVGGLALAVGAFIALGNSATHAKDKLSDTAKKMDELSGKHLVAEFTDATHAFDEFGVNASNRAKVGLAQFKAVAEENVGTAQRLLVALQGAGISTDGYQQILDKAVAKEKESSAAKAESSAATEKLTGDTAASTAAQDAATQAVDAYVSKVAGGLPTAASAFDNTKSAAEHFGASMSPEALLSGLEDSLNQIVSFTSNLKVIFDAGFTDIGALLQEKGAAAGGGLTQALADSIRAGDPATAAALDAKAQQVNVAGAVAANYATVQGGQVVANTAAEYAKLSPTVGYYMGLSVAEIGNWTPQMTAQAENAATVGLVMPFEGGIAPLPGNTANTMGQTVGAVQGSAGSLAGAGEGAGGGVAGGFGRGVAPLPGQAGAAVAGAAGPIQSAGASLASRDAFGAGYGVGESFDAGMQIGILTNMGGIISAAVQAVDAAEKAARAKANASSPSKLFAILGGDLAEGIAVGIDKGTPSVMSSAADLIGSAAAATSNAAAASNAWSPFTSAVGGGADRAGGGDTNIEFNIKVEGVSSPAVGRNIGEQIGEGAVDALSRRGYVVTARLG